MSAEIGAHAVELHTGGYAKAPKELASVVTAAKAARKAGLLVNAGHGLNYENVEPLLQAFAFDEFNIGFAIVARALFVGMENAVQEMKRRLAATSCAAS
jgi:pyridoxine 5-phosphate synthase